MHSFGHVSWMALDDESAFPFVDLAVWQTFDLVYGSARYGLGCDSELSCLIDGHALGEDISFQDASPLFLPRLTPPLVVNPSPSLAHVEGVLDVAILSDE